MPVSNRFAKEVTTLLVRLGISQREAAKRTRISPGYVSNMCLGQVPSMGKLLQFTSGLGVDPEPLMAAAGYPAVRFPGLSHPEPVVRAFEQPGETVPLLGEVPGGDWRLAARGTSEHYPIHQAYAEVTDFCLRIVGDSMWPHLQEGDIVGVKAQHAADHGQIVVARLGDEVTVKCWRFEQGHYLLAPFNPLYQPISIELDNPDFAIVGIVAWHTHDWLLGDDRVTLRKQKGGKRGTPTHTRG